MPQYVLLKKNDQTTYKKTKTKIVHLLSYFITVKSQIEKERKLQKRKNPLLHYSLR